MSAAPTLRFGSDSKLYYNSAGQAGATWSSQTWAELTDVHESVDAKLQYKEADSTRRGYGPIETSEPTLLGAEISWTMLEILNDGGFLAMRSAFYGKTIQELLMCSAAYSTSGETYLRGDFKIHGMDKGEPIDGINTYKFTAKPCASANLLTTGTTPIGAGGLG